MRLLVDKNHLINNSNDAEEAIGIKFKAVNFKNLAHLLSSMAVWLEPSSSIH